MKHSRWAIFIVAIAMMGGTAAFLLWFGSHQRLGEPGIKSTPIPGQVKMKIGLPAKVLDFTSTNMAEQAVVTNMLPRDTSFAQRRYVAPDGFWVNANIILMGTDRTSIHKPEYCLPGQGWKIREKSVVAIPIPGWSSYKLPVAKWVASTMLPTGDGGKVPVNCLYVFWFVARNEETTSHWQRVWWLARDMMFTGVLQRWAYVSYFAVCEPGQEDATFRKMQRLIAASVPEFQLPPTSNAATAMAKE